MDDRSRGDRGSEPAADESDGRIPIAPSTDLDWTDRDDEPSTPPTARDSDPESVRSWALLSAALGVIAVLVGGLALRAGAVAEAGGAGLLALAFLVVATLGARRSPRLLGSIAAGWDEHRRYAGFAVALFAAGAVGGVALGGAGYNLLEIITELTGENPFAGIEEGDLTAWWFVRNNTLPFLVAVAGAITLGLLTAYILLFNGLLVGNVAWFAGGAVGVDYLLVGLLPHGIFELTALFVAAAVGFRLFHRFVQRVVGTREAILTRPYLRRTAALLGFAWLVLVLAAFVEVYVTGPLIEELFATRLETA